MDPVPLHMKRARDCDCGTCCDGCGHGRSCMSGKGAQVDIGQEVAQEDGYMR